MACPCWIGEDPDGGECYAIVAYHIDTGEISGLDVSNLSLVIVAHIPGNVLAGNWEVVVLVDSRATEEQREAVLAAFTGQARRPAHRRLSADRNGQGRRDRRRSGTPSLTARERSRSPG